MLTSLPYRLLPSVQLILLAIALILISLPASAQSPREIRIADYALSFGPEAQRSADGHGDRNYLAQVRFQGIGRAKQTTPVAQRDSEPSSAASLIARSKSNSQIAVRQVVALESALWKRANSQVMIADNNLVAPLQETRVQRVQTVAYGPQPLVGPQRLTEPLQHDARLGACEVQAAPTVTLTRAAAPNPAQSELSRLQVTLPQDRLAESC